MRYNISFDNKKLHDILGASQQGNLESLLNRNIDMMGTIIQKLKVYVMCNENTDVLSAKH